jgi:hypothetical protein
MTIFSPTDMEAAAARGARCGHGALAAALGIPVLEAMKHLKSGWVNVPMMKRAIEAHGRRWKRVERPEAGDTAVILVQFLGPWMDEGKPPALACRYRHWVACNEDGQLWDANWPGWMPHDVWKTLAPELLPEESNGYVVWGALEIL